MDLGLSPLGVPSGNSTPPPPPPQTTDASSPSGTGGCGFSLNVTAGPPPGTGARHDSTDPPSSGQGFAGYTWNQAAIAMFGGCGDGSFGNLPPEGTWSNPLTLETAHYAILSIRKMLANYAQTVDDACAQITGNSWSGPAADAFSAVMKAFTNYLRAVQAEMDKYPETGDNLLYIAHMNEAFGQACGFIWQVSTFADGHDRSTPVTLSGDITYQGSMDGAGDAMVAMYSDALAKLV